MPEAHLEEGEVIIRNSEQNEGMLAFLLEKNIARDTGKRVQSGWISCPVVEMLPESEWKEDFDGESLGDTLQNVGKEDGEEGDFWPFDEESEDDIPF